MNIFVNNSGKLVLVKGKPFKLEREIQQLFESNLSLLMKLDLVKSEFTIKGRRIDTLAFDPQTKAFIIIEYKRDKNISVVDQGFAYLSLMLENKADFVLTYNEELGKTLRLKEVDWTQTRVIFVSPSFTENQIQAIGFKDFAVELWQIKRYENNTVIINNIKGNSYTASVKTVTQKSQAMKRVTDELKVYTEQDHLDNASESIVELYEKFKNAILNLTDDIEIKPQKVYIAFKKSTNIVDIEIQKKSLRISINVRSGLLDDPKKLARNVAKIGHRGNGDYLIQVSDDGQLEYILSLVKQAI